MENVEKKFKHFKVYSEERELVHEGKHRNRRNAALHTAFGAIPQPFLCKIEIQKDGMVQVWGRSEFIQPMKFKARYWVEEDAVEKQKKEKKKKQARKNHGDKFYRVFNMNRKAGDKPVYEGYHKTPEYAFWKAAVGYVPPEKSLYSIQVGSEGGGVMRLYRYSRKLKVSNLEKTLVVIECEPPEITTEATGGE